MTHPAWLEEVKARLKAATPGPWRWYQLGGSAHLLSEATPQRRAVLTSSSHNRTPYIAECGVDGYLYRIDADAELSPNIKLIAHAPTDLTRAISEIEEREKRIENLESQSIASSKGYVAVHKADASRIADLQAQLSDRDKAIAGLEAENAELKTALLTTESIGCFNADAKGPYKIDAEHYLTIAKDTARNALQEKK